VALVPGLLSLPLGATKKFTGAGAAKAGAARPPTPSTMAATAATVPRGPVNRDMTSPFSSDV